MQHEKTRDDGVPIHYAPSPANWRSYLIEHHATNQSVWLLLYKKNSGVDSVKISEAIDEALCFGWIDSKPNKRDQDSYYVFFSRRNPKSNWSRVNKEKIARLEAANKLAAAGIEMVRLAKETGTWNALDQVENLVVPKDMELAFAASPAVAKANWENFPRSVKRSVLEWIFNAKRPTTRANRIQQAVEKASHNERANQWP